VALEATPLAGAVTRRTSRMLPGAPVPQRVAVSAASHARAHPQLGIEVRTVVDPSRLERHPAQVDPRRFAPAFEQDTNWSIPARVVATVPGGRVYGDSAAVIAPDDTLLWDLSPAHVPSPWQHPIFRRPVLPRPLDVEANVAVLSARGSSNYFHFLLDVAPRIALLGMAMPMDEIDHVFVDDRTRWQREILEAAGIPLDRVLSPRKHPHVRAGRLVVPSLPGSGPKMNPRWAVEAVRGWLLNGQVPAEPRRIYVSRGDDPLTRRVVNEADVSDALSRLGFVTVRNEEHSVHEQAAMFAAAEVVVGAHGANLANVAFCSPGATLVELASPLWLNTTYWRLCAQLDRVRHRCVVGRGDAPSDLRQHDVNADIEVDLRLLLDTLRGAGIE
jgi:capsular polysaccharide biosynthesis protein